MTPVIVVTVGLPGSGKTTYLRSLGAHPLSSDAIRLLLADDETDQTIHGRVFQTLRFVLRQRLELRRPVTYVDATNISRKDRRPYIHMGREFRCRVEALVFDTPLQVCLQRNDARGRVVPSFVLHQMAARYIPPSTAEGFDAISHP